MGDASDRAPRLSGIRADLRLCAVRDGVTLLIDRLARIACPDGAAGVTSGRSVSSSSPIACLPYGRYA